MTQEERRRLLHVRRPDSQRLPSERAAFAAAFERRYGETSQAFWSAVEGRAIKSDDLKLLSRFQKVKARQSLLDEARKKRIEDWHLSAIEHLRVA
jgi:hypothetical protein